MPEEPPQHRSSSSSSASLARVTISPPEELTKDGLPIDRPEDTAEELQQLSDGGMDTDEAGVLTYNRRIARKSPRDDAR